MTQTTDFTVMRSDLAVGTTHAGFTVTATEALPELAASAYVMRHDASGARALWIACADTNRSFAIAFKTPPADDTGVFHILEHSVLCGSDRFPVKEPFVNLLKTSMHTFLNALTFPDKTMYPVASTNVTDLENLMDVYLDAVLHPAIYHRPRIFEQEGWHLELEDPDAPLTYNGVVFNEMKGSLSDPDEVLYLNVCRSLFPDSPYGFESGGTPRAIPTLTYERFLDSHARHYRLDNSYSILYGDLDIDRELAFIDRRFQGAIDRDAPGTPNPLPLQTPVTAPPRRVEMATAPENAAVALASVVGTAADRERMLATDILLDAIAGSNEAPLKRAILDADLGEDFTASLLDGMLQPQLLFQLKGAHDGVAEAFRELVERTCRKLSHDGIDRKRIEASLAQAEFNLREGDWGSYGDGVALSMQVLNSWLYDDERPVDYLRYDDAIAHMRAHLDTGYFERLLAEITFDNAHSALVELVPVADGDATEEANELARRKASMGEADLVRVMAEVDALRAEQEAPDAPEDLAKLPRLSLADIGDAPLEPPMRDVEAPLPCWAHELETKRIDYAYHYFDLRHLAFDELPYASMLTTLLGKLDTDLHSAAALDTLVEANLGSLDFFVETHGRDEDLAFVHPSLVVGASALAENVEGLATIPSEVWGHTRFDDTERVRAILQQKRIALEQHFTGAGHAAAMARLSSYFGAPAAVSDALGGVSYYLFLKELLNDWDARADILCDTLASLARRIFTASNVTVSFTGPAKDRDAFWQAGGSLGLAPDERTKKQMLVPPRRTVRNEAFIVPANVCFVAEGQAPTPMDGGTNGSWIVASRALSYDYLWNEVRVKGGAYGTGFRHTTAGLTQFWSYRDPGIDASVRRFEEAARWLSRWSCDRDELDGYIVSCVAAHDLPLKPRRLARRQDTERLAGRPDDWRRQLRKQMLAATSDDIRALAATLEGLSTRRGLCVFGGKELIEASTLGLTVVELMG